MATQSGEISNAWCGGTRSMLGPASLHPHPAQARTVWHLCRASFSTLTSTDDIPEQPCAGLGCFGKAGDCHARQLMGPTLRAWGGGEGWWGTGRAPRHWDRGPRVPRARPGVGQPMTLHGPRRGLTTAANALDRGTEPLLHSSTQCVRNSSHRLGLPVHCSESRTVAAAGSQPQVWGGGVWHPSAPFPAGCPGPVLSAIWNGNT